MDQISTPARLNAFSDSVFAIIIITILVLELQAPKAGSFSALLPLWSIALGYAVSYLFLAIVWVNHHHLLRYAQAASPRLIWSNFAHLFCVSLLPFSTAWMARTHLAPAPVSVYAGVFVLVNATYLLLCHELVDRPRRQDERARRLMLVRSILTLATFATAAVVSLRFPLWGLALCCACLAFYASPGVPTVGMHAKAS